MAVRARRQVFYGPVGTTAWKLAKEEWMPIRNRSLCMALLVVLAAVAALPQQVRAAVEMSCLGDEYYLFWGSGSDNLEGDWSLYTYPEEGERKIGNGQDVDVKLPRAYSCYYVALVSDCAWTNWLLETLGAQEIGGQRQFFRGPSWQLTGSLGTAPCMPTQKAGFFYNDLMDAGVVPMDQLGQRFEEVPVPTKGRLTELKVKLIGDKLGGTAFRLLVLAK